METEKSNQKIKRRKRKLRHAMWKSGEGRYNNLIEPMAETFADSITGFIFDGQTLRIEFGITRFDNVKGSAPITGRRYPACRLVLPP